jgi:hypothetical protein
MSTTAQATTRAARHQDVFDDLIDLGHELVRLVVDHAKTGATPPPTAAIAYERITRSIRLSALLSRKFDEPVQTVDRVATRKRIIRVVEDAIQRHDDVHEAEHLQAELHERLDTPDLEDELGDRPVEDIIADIIRDLGLAASPGAHPWKRRTPAEIAELCTRAAQTPGHTATRTANKPLILRR